MNPLMATIITESTNLGAIWNEISDERLSEGGPSEDEVQCGAR